MVAETMQKLEAERLDWFNPESSPVVEVTQETSPESS